MGYRSSTRAGTLLLGALLCALFIESSAFADSPLEHIPADALVVIHARGIERTAARMQAALDRVVPDSGVDLAAHFRRSFGPLAELSELHGLAKGGPAFLVLRGTPRAGRMVPTPVLVLRTVDHDALEEELAGGESFVRRDGEYAIVGADEDAVEAAAAAEARLHEIVPARTAVPLLTSDLAVYLRPAAIMEQYGATLRMLSGMARAMAKPPAGDAAVVESAESAIADFLKARHALLALDFRPEGVAVHVQDDREDRGAPRADGAVALELIDALPGGFAWYLESVGDSASLAERFAGRVDDPALADALRDAVERAGVRRTLECAFPGRLRVCEARAPAQLTLAALAIERQRGAAADADESTVRVEHRGFRLHRGDGRSPLERDAEREVRQKLGALPDGVSDALFGLASQLEEGAGSAKWFGHSDERFLEVSASSWEEAAALIDRFLEPDAPIAQDPEFADSRRELPSRRHLVSMVRSSHLTGMLSTLAGAASDAAAAESEDDPSDPPEDARTATAEADGPYLAFAGFDDGALAGYDVWVPLSALRTFVELGEQLKPLGKLLREARDAR